MRILTLARTRLDKVLAMLEPNRSRAATAEDWEVFEGLIRNAPIDEWQLLMPLHIHAAKCETQFVEPDPPSPEDDVIFRIKQQLIQMLRDFSDACEFLLNSNSSLTSRDNEENNVVENSENHQ